MIAASLGDLTGGAVRANDQSSALEVQGVRAQLASTTVHGCLELVISDNVF
jgi:hypothetical protein